MRGRGCDTPIIELAQLDQLNGRGGTCPTLNGTPSVLSAQHDKGGSDCTQTELLQRYFPTSL